MRSIRLTALFLLICVPTLVIADDGGETKQIVADVVAAVGGEDKLFSLFRFGERVLIASEPAAPAKPDEKENRTSVVQVAKNWWLCTAKQNKDNVRILCWAWSLKIRLEPTSKIQPLPEITVSDKPAFGLGVTKVPLDLYFDKESKRLVAIDYTDTRHVFSEWKTTEAGHEYPSHATGFRFADQATGKLQPMQWYQPTSSNSRR